MGQSGVTYSVASISNADSYVWSLPPGVTGNSTTNIINVNFNAGSETGNTPAYLTVKPVNSFGEGSTSTKAVTVVGTIPSIKTKWKDVLVCSDVRESIDSYQWYKDDVAINNANGQFYVTSKQSGSYKVEIVDKEGCRNFSNNISVSGTGSISVYPNPASLSFALKINDQSEGSVLVSVFNTSGIKVAEYHSENLNGELLKNIPVSNLDNGIYIVRVILNNNLLYHTRIVVMK